MPRRPADPQRQDEDVLGNNIAFACPVCSKVYIVSGHVNRQGRNCPVCGRSTGRINVDGTGAEIEWDDQPE
jgi:hypothetical protein